MTDRLTDDQIRKVDAILQEAAGSGRSYLFEHEVYAILQLLGLQVPTYLFVTDPEELSGGQLCEFGTEKLVLKVVSGEIPHKTRVGGVRTVLRDRERIRANMRRMAATRCGSRIE